MKILVINAGSSSLKYQLFDMDKQEVLAKGSCECIGIAGGHITHKRPGQEKYVETLELPDHDTALARVFELLTDATLGVIGSIDEIDAVGHRFAHGGERCRESMPLDDEVLSYLETIIPLNPLHGPPAIAGLRACRRLLPASKPQVGVFDTAFYANIPDYRTIYALPYEFYTDKKVRRYGFHGTSHRYVSAEAAKRLGRPLSELKLVTCHLGNGSSITAVQNGVAVDTSMGFTPQEGVPMGTRSGSIDPTVVPYIMREYGLSVDEVENLLNRKSGLLGVTGLSSDAREIADAAHAGNERCILAQKMLGNAIKRIIGGYIAEMNGIDALIFTGGIGENDYDIRHYACEDMSYFGIVIDEKVNCSLPRGEGGDITGEGARIPTLVVPTDEEYMIALDTLKFCK